MSVKGARRIDLLCLAKASNDVVTITSINDASLIKNAITPQGKRILTLTQNMLQLYPTNFLCTFL